MRRLAPQAFECVPDRAVQRLEHVATQMLGGLAPSVLQQMLSHRASLAIFGRDHVVSGASRRPERRFMRPGLASQSATAQHLPTLGGRSDAGQLLPGRAGRRRARGPCVGPQRGQGLQVPVTDLAVAWRGERNAWGRADVPSHSFMRYNVDRNLNKTSRGLGGTPTVPVTSCAEENLTMEEDK